MNPYLCTDNKIGVEGTRYLAEALKINSGLTSLDFSCKRNKSILQRPRWDNTNPYFCTANNIGVEGTRYLAEALRINCSLTDVKCMRCQISKSSEHFMVSTVSGLDGMTSADRGNDSSVEWIEQRNRCIRPFLHRSFRPFVVHQLWTSKPASSLVQCARATKHVYHGLSQGTALPIELCTRVLLFAVCSAKPMDAAMTERSIELVMAATTRRLVDKQDKKEDWMGLAGHLADICMEETIDRLMEKMGRGGQARKELVWPIAQEMRLHAMQVQQEAVIAVYGDNEPISTAVASVLEEVMQQSPKKEKA